MITNNSNAQAGIDQSIRLPDYFSCRQCTAWQYGTRLCDEFQQAGRCRADMLRMAIESRAVQIVLHLPTVVTS